MAASSQEGSWTGRTGAQAAHVYSEVYEALIPCLQRMTPVGRPSHPHHAMGLKEGKQKKLDPSILSYPADAEAHYREILEKTAYMRGEEIPIARIAGYNGPWIENLFIDRFLGRPLSFFNGMIPIFAQFLDMHVHAIRMKNDTYYTSALFNLASTLRKDVIYVAVSQDDHGLSILSHLCPNVLVISAGGFGHIPIPLIKGEVKFKSPPRRFTMDVGFSGKIRQKLTRSRMLREVRSMCIKRGLKMKQISESKTWLEEIYTTSINLAPRGFGRTSYRLAEIIQAGRLPAYLYDDIKWIPYEGTEASIHNFGFVGRGPCSLAEMVDEMTYSLRDAGGTNHRLRGVKDIRHHYTYGGVLAQIELFFKYPLKEDVKGSYLRCLRESSSGLENFLRRKGFNKIEKDIESGSPRQLYQLRKLVDRPELKMMQIGFNSGASSELFLNNSYNDLKLTSFDINAHAYVRVAQKYIDEKFPGRHTLIIGDSTETVPRFANEHMDVKFDIIFIDGSHEYSTARQDMINSHRLAHKGTLVILDDTMFTQGWDRNWTLGPSRAWKDFVEESKVTEIGTEDYCPGRGMSWGKFNLS